LLLVLVLTIGLDQKAKILRLVFNLSISFVSNSMMYSWSNQINYGS